jgi:hypothetical protein
MMKWENTRPPFTYIIHIFPFISFSFLFLFCMLASHNGVCHNDETKLHYPTSFFCDLRSREACMPTWMFWPTPELLEPSKLIVFGFRTV